MDGEPKTATSTFSLFLSSELFVVAHIFYCTWLTSCRTCDSQSDPSRECGQPIGFLHLHHVFCLFVFVAVFYNGTSPRSSRPFARRDWTSESGKLCSAVDWALPQHFYGCALWGLGRPPKRFARTWRKFSLPAKRPFISRLSELCTAGSDSARKVLRDSEFAFW